MTKVEPTLPSNRAFVVQFRSTTELVPGQQVGRIEHLVSGRATHFESWEQLQGFIEQMLMQVSEKPP